MKRATSRKLLLGLLLSAAWPAANADAQQFQGLGDLPGGGFGSTAHGVSADGSVVVGLSESASGLEAFRWTQGGGMVGLGDLPGGSFFSQAYAVSADGSVVVGRGISASGDEAFRWTQGGGMVGLGDLPGGLFQSIAFGVSADGAVVVGRASSASGREAFRWTQGGGMVGLGDLPGGSFGSQAHGVSADGSVVVGLSESASGLEAFRWTQGGGMVGLGDLPGGSFQSFAFGVSADGSVVVGQGHSASGLEAFRWTQGGGMVGLGDLAGGSFFSQANGVSADGSVVVGLSESAGGFEAFRWTQVQGMRSVASLLADDGVNLGTWQLFQASAVSADGTVIVGSGVNPSSQTEAWWAKIGTGFLSAGALSASLQSMAEPPLIAQQTASADLSGALNASRQFGRGGLDYPVGSLSGWGSINASSFDTPDDGTIADGVIGLAYQASSSMRLGAGVRVRSRNAALAAFNGEVEADTLGLNGFLAYEPDASPLRIHAAAIAETVNAEVTRGYLNGVDPTTSRGSQDGMTYGASVSVGWELPMGGFSVTPFVGYELSQINLDAYTETSGPFPARFEKVDESLEIARLGAEARAALSETLNLWASANWAHRMDDRTPDVNGQVLALATPFTVSGVSVNEDWAEAEIGLVWAVGERTQLHVNIGGASDGDTAPSVYGGVGGAIRF